MKRSLVVVSGVALLLIAGASVWALQLVRPDPIPPEVGRLEEAMAVPGLVGIAHADVAHLLEVERRLVGEFDAEALAGEDSPVSELWRRGLDPGAMMGHWLAAYAGGPEGGAVQAVLGDFPVSEVRAALASHYAIAERDDLWILERDDPETCEPAAPIGLVLRPDLALFGDPMLVTRVRERLASGAQAAVDLSEWHHFRDGRAGSLFLTTPAQAVEGISDPFLRMAAGGMSEGLEPIEALYVGAVFGVVPPGMQIEVDVRAGDAGWPASQEQRFLGWRADLLSRSAADIPALATLLDRLTVRAEGAHLEASIAIDRGLGAAMGEAVSQGLEVAFRGSGAEIASERVGEERTLEASELDVVLASLDPATLPSVDPAQNMFAGPEAQEIAGPFALRVASRRIRRDLGDRLELEIALDSAQIPNLRVASHHEGERPMASLSVTSVRDRAGRELLAEEHCGPGRNGLPAALQSGSDMDFIGDRVVKIAPTWSGKKTVRLVPGAGLADVDRIEGHVDLRLATRVDAIRVTPAAGEVVEGPDVRLVFGDEEPGSDTFSYEVSGSPENVLAIRALNASGKYLSAESSHASSNTLRPGLSVTRTFAGSVASVEVLVAQSVEDRRTPFQLAGVAPRFADWDLERTVPTAQSRAGFEREVASLSLEGACSADQRPVEAAPFRLCFGSAQTSWAGLNAQVEVYAPKADSVLGNLSALEIALDEVAVRDAAGATHRMETEASAFSVPTPGWDEPSLHEQLWMSAPIAEESPSGDVVALRGRVVHRIPTRLERLALEMTRLGDAVEYDNGFGIRFVEVGEGRLHFELRGDRSRIVQLVVRDAAGAPLPLRSVQVDPGGGILERMLATGPATAWEDPDSRPRHMASLEVATPHGGTPSRVEVLYAAEVDERSHTFEIGLGEDPGSLAALGAGAR